MNFSEVSREDGVWFISASADDEFELVAEELLELLSNMQQWLSETQITYCELRKLWMFN